MSPLAPTLVTAFKDKYFGKVLIEWIFSRMPRTAKSLWSCTLPVGGSVLWGWRNKFEYPNNKGSLSLCVCTLVFVFRWKISFQSVSRVDEVWWTDYITLEFSSKMEPPLTYSNHPSAQITWEDVSKQGKHCTSLVKVVTPRQFTITHQFTWLWNKQGLKPIWSVLPLRVWAKVLVENKNSTNMFFLGSQSHI